MVSVAPPPLGGVAIARLVSRHRDDLAALGLDPPRDGAAAAAGAEPAVRETSGATMSFSTAGEAPGKQTAGAGTSHELLSPAVLKKAFHSAALRCHPDKLPTAEREVSGPRFASVKEAYSRLATAVQVQARALPEFPHVTYHLIEVGQPQLLAGVVAAELEQETNRDAELTEALGGVAIDPSQDDGCATPPPLGTQELFRTPNALSRPPKDVAQAAAALCEQLGAAADFMRSAVAGGGTVLVHAGELGADSARAILTALLHVYLVLTGETLEAASRSLHAAAGPPFLPAASFGGVRHGYTFTSGPSGLGYYQDAGGVGGCISGGLESLPMALRSALTEHVGGMTKRALVIERDAGAREAGLVATAAADGPHEAGSGKESRGNVKMISVVGSDGQVIPVIVEHAPGARLVSDGSGRVRSTAVG